MKHRSDGTLQIQAGGCKVLFTQHVADGIDDLDALDQDVEDIESVIAQLTAKRDALQELGRARLRLLREANRSMHAVVVVQPSAVSRVLRHHDGKDVSIAELKKLVKGKGGLAENQTAAA